MSEEAKKWVSDKIAYLIREEGLEPDQAKGKAFGMAKQKFPSVPDKK